MSGTSAKPTPDTNKADPWLCLYCRDGEHKQCTRKNCDCTCYYNQSPDDSTPPANTPKHDPVPPDGCNCASFWTVWGRHKADCPLAPKPTAESVDEHIEEILLPYDFSGALTTRLKLEVGKQLATAKAEGRREAVDAMWTVHDEECISPADCATHDILTRMADALEIQETTDDQA